MLYARPLINLDSIANKPLKLFWIPYVKIEMTLKNKLKAFCFDGLTPKLLDDPLLYVIFMRNPEHIKVEKGDIGKGKILSSEGINGKQIFDTILAIRDISSSLDTKAKKIAIQMLKKAPLQVLFPVQLMYSKKLAKYEDFKIIKIILESAGFYDEPVRYINSQYIYWPILIDPESQIVYEIALKLEPSKSYSELQRRMNLLEYLEKYDEQS